MPPKKKGGKGKKGKKQAQPQEEVPQYNIISVEDHFKRIHRHDFRIEAVRENDEAFREVSDEYEDMMKLEEEKIKWEKYVDCDKIPNLKSPPDIRTYLYKWLFDEWDIINSAFNWVLDIDERSILTQDLEAKDLTRNTLRKKVPIRGKFTSYHVGNALQMIDGLQKILEGADKDVMKHHNELIKARDEIRNRIRNSLDNLSYFVLYNTDGNMHPIDPISEQYKINTEPFDVALWGLRSVPCDFKKREMTELLIDLEAIESTVTLPVHALFEELLIRGLHMQFDHRSLYATSVDLVEPLPDVRDFKIALVKEWAHRRQIEQDKLKQMREQRQKYEDDLKAQEEEAKKEEASKKQKDKKGGKEKKKGKKKSKKPKILHEPPIVAVDTFLNIDADFIAADDLKHEKYMAKLSPELLKLQPKELNLREYIILGGVYEYNFLHKPGQLRLGSCYLNSKEMPAKIRYREFQCDVQYKERKTIKLSRESRLVVPMEVDDFGNPIEEQSEVQLNSLIKISVKLPSNLCRWCRPITCRWNSKAEDLLGQLERGKFEGLASEETNRAMPMVTHDMYLGTIEARKQLYYLIKNQILPRMDSLHKFPDEVAEEKERMQAIANEMERLRREAELDAEVIEDDADPSERTSMYKGKVIPDSTPPAALFPRPIEGGGLKISSHIIMDDEEEIQNLSDSDRVLLSQYLEDLDNLAEKRKPRLQTWWNILNLMGKHRPVSDVKLPISDEERPGSARSTKHGFERHPRKSMKKGKAKSMYRSNSKRSVSKFSDTSLKSAASLSPLIRSTRTSQAVEFELRNLTDEEETYSTSKGSWSTDGIYNEEFNQEKAEMEYWVDRLGIYGFAYKRYLHFPFKYWAVYPDNKSPDAIILEITSPFANFFIKTEARGYTVSVMVGHQAHAKIIHPTNYIRDLKCQMESLGLNIFSKPDSCVYVEDISPKHSPLEYHVYQTISQFCINQKFSRSKWNWLAHRRVLIMKYGNPQQQSYEMDTIKVTPEESIFCTITEACTPLDKVELEYNPTGKNIKFEPDLFSLLKTSTEMQKSCNPKVVYLVYLLLKAVQPLTFCK